MQIRLIVLWSAALLACRAGPPAPQAGPDAREPSPFGRGEHGQIGRKLQLPSGLTVVIQENHASPVIALQMWVKVGAADEAPSEHGVAHLHEHLLFHATKNRGPGDIAREVEALGGQLGAFTSFDHTVYHLALASRFFDAGLDVLADALQHPRFDDAEIKREIGVVREELRRSMDQPARRLSHALFETAYQKHPYRRPVTGSDEGLGKLTGEQVGAFYRRHYTADRMVLVVAGDVRESDVRERVAKAFADLGPASRPPQDAREAEPAQTEPRIRTILDESKDAHVSMAWHVPPIDHQDTFALDLLAVILGQGESARLPARLKRDRSLVSEIYGFAYVSKDPGLFAVGFTATAAKVKEAQAELFKEIYRLRGDAVSDAELKKAKTIVLSDTFYQKETVQGAARKLGFFESVAGDAGFETRYYHGIEGVSVADIRRVATKYLTTSNLTVVALVPKTNAAALAEADVLAAARGAEGLLQSRVTLALPAADARGVYKIALPSGTVVLVQEDHTVPAVALHAAFVGGLRFEDRQSNGINHLLARLITQGTLRRSTAEIASRVEAMAAALEGFSGQSSFGLRGEFLKATFSEGLDLFAEMLTQPAFSQETLDRERAIVLEEIRSREDTGSSVAFDLFAETLYEQHPFKFRQKGTVEAVSALKADDLAEFYKKHYPRHRMVIAVVGDVYADEVLAQLNRLFGSPVEKPSAPPPSPPVEPLPSAPRVAERFKERQQAHLVFGFRGAGLADKARYPLELLSTILSGQGGRLARELRVKQSLAYSVDSFSIEGLDTGYFATYVATSPEKLDLALAALKSELQRVAAGPLSNEEIDRARRYLIGRQALSLQTPGARAASLALNEAYGVGYAAEFDFGARIAAVTPADLARAAQSYFDFDRSVLATVRPPARKAVDLTSKSDKP